MEDIIYLTAWKRGLLSAERNKRMAEKEFNLLEEPWIRVLADDLSVKEVSLTDALVNAHKYRKLAGEMPTQDVAILRLLLACIQTIFYRYDAQGNKDPIDEDWDEEMVIDRWEEYLNAGCFSEQCIRGYLNEYKERFWLFHPKTPFYQVADLSYGTDYGAQGLLGNLKSSNNKATKYHFSMNEGMQIQSLPYADAARWLVNLNAYSVNVKSDKKAPGTKDAAGTGRLGKLGLIYVDASDLFELILRNLVPLNPTGEVWGSPSPIWEQEIHDQQSIAIVPPDNLPERYTLQSRRILLNRDDGRVIGVRAANGDFFGYEDDFGEPMTLWKKTKKGTRKDAPIVYMPKQHKPHMQIWREFSSIFITDEGTHIPGVVHWINMLCKYDLIPRDEVITLRTAGIRYGDGMSYTYGDSLSDGLSLSAVLLAEMGRDLRTLIQDEIEKCVLVTDMAMKLFAAKAAQVLNLNSSEDLSQKLTEEFYAQIDGSFREWLSGIKPLEDQKEMKAAEWEEIAFRVARDVVQEKVEGFGENLFLFRESGGDVVSIPQAYNQYLWRIRGLYGQDVTGAVIGESIQKENGKE